MNISDNIDRWRIIKDTIKNKLKRRLFCHDSAIIDKIIRHNNIKGSYSIVHGNPNTIIIISDTLVVRIPMDPLGEARCNLGKMMLQNLENTSIAAYTPKFLNKEVADNYRVYYESRMPGYSIDIPLRKMDWLVKKAADLIGGFHKVTSKEIRIDDDNYGRLIGHDFRVLKKFLPEDWHNLLGRVEKKIYRQVIGKVIKTVWSHGDFKIENVLFDIRKWEITGIIDWDLSKRQGLPLLDIIYLLIYKESLMTRKHITSILEGRYLGCRFNSFEEAVITEYLKVIDLDDSLIRPLMVLFWMNHLSQRCRCGLMLNLKNKTAWLQDNGYNIFSLI